ncbi:MAG: acyltransferase family protein [Lachnospiraceae bacterium]|nr:acyltransferase family protein [Candidatus Colinaster scatohippi]
MGREIIKKRNDMVDISRLLFALCLMYHHTYVFILYDGAYPFCHASRYFVEAFLIWTGYFTYKHFAGHEYSNYPGEGFKYWLSKFSSFLPYTIPAILVQYIMDSLKYWGNGGTRSAIASFYEMPFEMLYLRETYTASARVVPLWFLSAMFLVFPLMLLLIGIKNKYTIAIISFLYPAFYYGKTAVSGIRDWPNDLLRAMAGLCLGILIGALFDICADNGYSVTKEDNKGAVAWLLTIAELLAILFPVVCSFFDFDGTDKLCLLSIVIAIAIMLSGRSYTASLKIPFASYMGRLSLPLYIWQWGVAWAINLFMNNGEKNGGNVGLKLAIYFVLTFVISVVSMTIVDMVKKKNISSYSIRKLGDV